MDANGDCLKFRAARLRSMRKRILRAAQTALSDLDPADQAELDPAVIDCVDGALSDEIGPLIAGLETEAAVLTEASDDDWLDVDRRAVICTRIAAA